MNYYVVAKNADGKGFVISSSENVRLFAQQEIAEECNQRGLVVNLDEVRKVSGSGNQGSTNTKFFKHRKKHNGENGEGYYSAL
jgi:hypothetical protein